MQTPSMTQRWIRVSEQFIARYGLGGYFQTIEQPFVVYLLWRVFCRFILFDAMPPNELRQSHLSEGDNAITLDAEY